jgi:hypothetical protein
MPMPPPAELLPGPYQAPRLQVGTRTHGLLRDSMVMNALGRW